MWNGFPVSPFNFTYTDKMKAQIDEKRAHFAISLYTHSFAKGLLINDSDWSRSIILGDICLN